MPPPYNPQFEKDSSVEYNEEKMEFKGPRYGHLQFPLNASMNECIAYAIFRMGQQPELNWAPSLFVCACAKVRVRELTCAHILVTVFCFQNVAIFCI